MLPAKPGHPVGTIVLKVVVLLFPIVLLVVLSERDARAVPSYSRQTGLSCATCHYAPPELNPFGRKFKLDGYTLTTKPEVTDDKKERNSGLKLLESFPLSVIFFTSFTSTQKSQTPNQNGNFQFPQQASLFLAGSWGDHVGSFAQVTYTQQGNHFGWDNTDIRYANSSRELFGKSWTYGVTFNNNPTVEDLWNSTPAWGYPFSTSNVSPKPSAVAVINGTLGQDVAGIGAYTMWDDHWYLVGTVYRSAHLAGPLPNPEVNNLFPFNISGVAPYWRFAWQTSTTNNNLEVGTYGIWLKSFPNAVTGLKNSYTDWAVDFQYDRTIPQFKNDVLSFRGTYIRENSSLLGTLNLIPPGADQARHHLNTVQGNVEYHFGNRVSLTGAFFNITGTADKTLFLSGTPVFGSATGSPASTGYIAEINWWPQQNIKLGAQYTGFTRFNGATNNYDGSGRDASANNSTYLIVEFVF
jgi:hypothetical protein